MRISVWRMLAATITAMSTISKTTKVRNLFDCAYECSLVASSPHLKYWPQFSVQRKKIYLRRAFIENFSQKSSVIICFRDRYKWWAFKSRFDQTEHCEIKLFRTNLINTNNFDIEKKSLNIFWLWRKLRNPFQMSHRCLNFQYAFVWSILMRHQVFFYYMARDKYWKCKTILKIVLTKLVTGDREKK